jgi:hypothetical protein
MYSIIFRLEPFGFHGDRYLFQAACKVRKQWCTSLGIHPKCFTWYNDNIRQHQNRKPIRLYVIFATGKPPAKEAFVALGEEICHHVNIEQGNNTVTKVDESTYFWRSDNTVWSDIIGFDKALLALFDRTGPPHTGYFEEHVNLIHSYFHAGTLSYELKKTLYAPQGEVDAVVCDTIAKQGHMDGE